MFEKVNPSHPDKLADRIAGALVDMAYEAEENPRIAVEVLIGHGKCHIICETSVRLKEAKVAAAVRRIAGDVEVDYKEVPQDAHLADNQREEIRCGDNGIFRGLPVTPEERQDAFIDGILEKVRLLAEKAVRKDYDPTVHEKQAFAEIVSIVDDMKGWF